MNETPLVTVILTTYNQGQWLRSAVESVISQTETRWELLLVDNGSTDETPGILELYRDDPRITVIRHERNRYHTVISNEAFQLATGKYVCFLYGDDYFLPQKLEKQVALFERSPDKVGCISCRGYRLIEASGELIADKSLLYRGYVLEDLLRHPAILAVAPMVRRECVLRYPYNESRFMEGESIFIKVAMRWDFDYVDEHLFGMRTHERNMGREIELAVTRIIGIFEDIVGHPDFPPEQRHRLSAMVGAIYRAKGWETIRVEREYERGRKWLLTALRHNRTELRHVRLLLGLALSTMPRSQADLVLDLMNRVFGTPPAPPSETYGV